MHLATYLGLLESGSRTLASSYRQVAAGHRADSDVPRICALLALQCDRHEKALEPIRERYGDHPEGEPERLHAAGMSETRTGGLGLLRDLHDLYLLVSYLDLGWTLVGQAAQGNRDGELVGVTERCGAEIAQQLAWLRTRTKIAAPQALLVAD